ncbi:hypothetical protein Tco_0781343, partial [Tanacetum coccineum]
MCIKEPQLSIPRLIAVFRKERPNSMIVFPIYAECIETPPHVNRMVNPGPKGCEAKHTIIDSNLVPKAGCCRLAIVNPVPFVVSFLKLHGCIATATLVGWST